MKGAIRFIPFEIDAARGEIKNRHRKALRVSNTSVIPLLISARVSQKTLAVRYHTASSLVKGSE